MHNPAQVKGLFWNYYSVGLDAQAAYGFHSLREKRPWATPTRTINQGWYSFFSCTTGWFCKAPPVRNKVALKVRGACAHQLRRLSGVLSRCMSCAMPFRG